MVEGLSGRSAEEIVQVSPAFIKDTGLNASLTRSRSNGFYNIFQAIKQKALQLLVLNRSLAKPNPHNDASEMSLRNCLRDISIN